MTLQKAQVGDIQMAYRWDGNPAGPLIMMAHAMGTSHRIWDQQVPAMSDRYRILRYDWRGHGDTDAPAGPYTLAMFEADAVGLMDVLGLEAVNWVGISTGGMIGQGLAINHPTRISTLTLCNTTSQSSPWYRDWVAERQTVVRRDGMVPVWDMTKNLWFTDEFVDAASPDYHAVRNVFIATQVPGYLGGTSAVAGLAYRDHLHLIGCPTRIIAAGADPVTPVDHSEIIRDRIQGAELTVIEGQHHFSNVEVPAEFNSALLTGLDQMIPEHSILT
ncbi:MAG: alpha/beta fold hydrolase [Pseudomonadota bacterium]